MNFYPTERIALFIDGANLYATAKALGFDIDYKRLLALFRTKGQLVRALYYTALAEDQEYSSIRPLVDWLDYNGYTMVTKPTKEFTDALGRRKIKGNMDIELTVDAMRLVESLDHVVLFTGDGDFRALVAALQQCGRRVSVVSTLQTQPPMVADELRRQADQFIDLADLEDQICRDPASRPVREPREGGAHHQQGSREGLHHQECEHDAKQDGVADGVTHHGHAPQHQEHAGQRTRRSRDGRHQLDLELRATHAPPFPSRASSPLAVRAQPLPRRST